MLTYLKDIFNFRLLYVLFGGVFFYPVKMEAGMMRLSAVLTIFVSFLCATCSHTRISSMGISELVGTEWLLEDLGGDAVTDVQSSIRFEKEDKIVGWGGCNRYFANVRSDGSNIDIGPIGSTRQICPSVVMDQEERFLRPLKKPSISPCRTLFF